MPGSFLEFGNVFIRGPPAINDLAFALRFSSRPAAPARMDYFAWSERVAAVDFVQKGKADAAAARQSVRPLARASARLLLQRFFSLVLPAIHLPSRRLFLLAASPISLWSLDTTAVSHFRLLRLRLTDPRQKLLFLKILFKIILKPFTLFSSRRPGSCRKIDGQSNEESSISGTPGRSIDVPTFSNGHRSLSSLSHKILLFHTAGLNLIGPTTRSPTERRIPVRRRPLNCCTDGRYGKET